MSKIIIAGPDSTDLGSTLTEEGATIASVPAPVTVAALEAAGLSEADLFVLTEHEEATAIPIVRERRPTIPIVVYTADGVPDFASHLADLIISPNAMDQPVVIEELLERAARDSS